MIFIASDHAGVELKAALQKKLSTFQWKDLGPATNDRVDYPDLAEKLANALLPSFKKDAGSLGVLICGSGVGMSIAANKVKGIRAAHAETIETAKLAREHNDANVLCIGARSLEESMAFKIVQTFLETPFSGDARHKERIAKISKLEKR